MEDLSYKRRGVLEEQLDANYHGRFVAMEAPNKELLYGRIQTIGIECDGQFSYTVTINLDGKRVISDYDNFIKTTQLL